MYTPNARRVRCCTRFRQVLPVRAKKTQKFGPFLTAAEHHHPPQKHHHLTTKTPCRKTPIFPKLPQNTHKQAKKSPGHRRDFFLQNQD
jgi:hypothetical protein